MVKVDLVKFWRESAQRDRKIAEDLFDLKHYHMALFIWQLVLEKLLKSRITKTGGQVVPTHNLLRLVKETDIKLSEDQKKQLAEITTFNIEARYDDYKLHFYRKATVEFTRRWVKVCVDLYKFIDTYD